MYKRRDWCPGYSDLDRGSGTVAKTVLQDHLRCKVFGYSTMLKW